MDTAVSFAVARQCLRFLVFNFIDCTHMSFCLMTAVIAVISVKKTIVIHN